MEVSPGDLLRGYSPNDSLTGATGPASLGGLREGLGHVSEVSDLKIRKSLLEEIRAIAQTSSDPDAQRIVEACQEQLDALKGAL